VLSCLGLINGRDVNTAWNGISFLDRQRSPLGRQRNPRRFRSVFSKQSRNDGVSGDTAAELGARDLTHPLQFQLFLARVHLADFQQ
jgi:hypothetical protein